MNKSNFVRKGMIVAGVTLALTACSPTFRNHGYAPSELDLADVIVGVDTRDSLVTSIGEPSIAGVIGEDSWYYVGSRWRHFAYRKPEVLEREVVAISFTEDGVVENIERFGLERGQVVAINRRVTETNIQNVNLIRQLINSVGNVSADQLIN